MKGRILSNNTEITMMSLLKKAPLLLLGRLEILLLLSVLYGILAGVVTYPVFEAIRPIISEPDADASAIIDSLGAQLPVTILVTMLINSALLIPITRLLVDSEPFEGGIKKFLTRFSRIFVLQLTAIALFLAFIFAVSLLLGILSVAMPQALMIIVAVAAGFVGLLVIYTVANVAIVGEAIDSPSSLMLAWHMIRPLIVPLAAAYGAIKILSMILSTLVSLVFGGLLSSFDIPWLPTMIDQAFGFAAQILHFGACLWATQAIMHQRKKNDGQS